MNQDRRERWWRQSPSQDRAHYSTCDDLEQAVVKSEQLIDLLQELDGSTPAFARAEFIRRLEEITTGSNRIQTGERIVYL